ncbi:MAG: copper resistance protein CopC [Acidimicrobiales bacterium]
MRFHRLVARVLLVGLTVVLVLLGVASPAHAHAVLDASTPASGAQLEQAPKSVRLDFDEAVGLDLGYVRLSSGDEQLEVGRAHHPAGRPDVVVADLPDLGDGVYVVAYRVISEDGHPVTGDIAFRVGAGAASPSAVMASASSGGRWIGLAYGAVRMAAYLALVVAIGLPIVASIVHAPWWSSIRLAVVGASGAIAVAALCQVALAGPYLAGTSWGDVIALSRWSDVVGTPAGRWWLLRAAAATALAGTMWAVTRHRAGPGARGAMAVCVLAAIVTWTFVVDGHAVTGRWVVGGEAATFGHLVAMATWLAGLVLLFVAAPGIDGELTGRVSSRWSPLAAGCVGVIVVTGLAQSWRSVDGWDPSSHYQRLLLAKTIGLVGMLAVAQGARRLIARVGSDGSAPLRLRRAVAIELAIGIAVLAITTVLVQTPPVDASPQAPAPTSVPTTVVADWTNSVSQGNRTLLLHMDGATVGRHTMHLVLDDSADPLTAPVTARARLLLPARSLGPFPIELSPAGPNSWTAPAIEIPESGEWRLEVIVDDPSSTIRFSTPLVVER